MPGGPARSFGRDHHNSRGHSDLLRNRKRSHPHLYRDTIRVTASGGVAAVERLPGVEQVRDLGQVQELRLMRGADPQVVLRALVAQARVTSFSLMKPSLHDIFMRIAGPAAEEASHANA
jgi:ABC-type uncharacterized transport system ATPase subunit